LFVFFLQGIEYPTPLVDAFLGGIFNQDSELVDYVRKLYGYALNGHTREEIFVLLLGAGGEHLID
jgi:phage/plasmid-associated DNA primase